MTYLLFSTIELRPAPDGMTAATVAVVSLLTPCFLTIFYIYVEEPFSDG